MSNNSIIEHKGSMYYVEFREEYLILSKNSVYKKPDTPSSKCKASPYCKALILAVLESWTNEKRGKGQDLGIYMTYPQWIDSMYGMFGRTVIIDSLDELLGEKLISRESHRMYGKDTYKYYLDYKEINKRLRALEDRDPNVTRPQVNASTSKPVPSTSKRVASTSKPVTRPQVNEYPSISGRNIESTNNHYLETTEKQQSIVVTADADANDTPAKIISQSPLLVEESVQPTQPAKTKEAQPKEKKESAAKPTAEKKPRKVPGVPDEEVALRDEIHALINKRRGYALLGRATAKQVIDENKACVILANLVYRANHGDPEGCTLDELNKEWDHLAKNDKYWKLQGNRERIGAHTLLQMHAQTLPLIRKPAVKPATQTGSPTRQLTELEKSNREKQARYAKAN